MNYDRYSVAQMNKSMVFDLIRKQGPISRAEMARRTRLSVPTIMKITDEFWRKKLIREVGKGESSGGKRPELLELIPDSKYSIGVGIGRSKTNVLIMNLSGEVVERRLMDTGDTSDAKEWITRLIDTMEGVICASGIPEEFFLGIGIGMPGIIDGDSGCVLFSPDFKWENVDLLHPVKKRFGMEVTIENANRALAMGEHFFGAGVDSKNFLMVNLGHGIGSAIMREGDFYRGSSGSSGEIGHIILEKDGPLCNCGNKGCLEAIASGNAIARDGKIAVLKGKTSLLLDMAGEDINGIEAKTVFEAALQRDEASVEITDRAMQYIGIGLANYINLLDPDLIILSGGLTGADNIFFTKMKEVLRKSQMKFAGRQVRLAVSQMGINGTAIGSASLVLKNFIKYGN